MQGTSPMASPASRKPARTATTSAGRCRQNAATASSSVTAPPPARTATGVPALIVGAPNPIVMVSGMVQAVAVPEAAAGIDAAGIAPAVPGEDRPVSMMAGASQRRRAT